MKDEGSYNRTLCVCSMGMLRSPTAAEVLSSHWAHNCRACGTDGAALIRLTPVLVNWADVIVCMERAQEEAVKSIVGAMVIEGAEPQVITLGIPDRYAFRDQESQRMVYDRFRELYSKPARKSIL